MPKNNYFARVSSFRPFLFRLGLLLTFVILLAGFSTSAFGQIAIPLSQLNSELDESRMGDIGTIKKLGDKLFIGTDSGIWIVSKDGRQVTRVKNFDEEVRIIKTIDEHIFIGTNNGLWLIGKDNEPVHVDGVEGSVTALIEFAGEIFVGSDGGIETAEGLWIVSKDGTKVSKVKYINVSINNLEIVGEWLFVDTAELLWVIHKNDNQAHQFGVGTNDVDESGIVESIKKGGDHLFVLTLIGNLWIVNNYSKQGSSMELLMEDVRCFESVGDKLFVGTKEGLLVISQDSKQVSPFEGISGEVTLIKVVRDKIFVVADKVLWIINKDRKVNKIELINQNVDSSGRDFSELYVETFGDRLFVGTDAGLWVISKDDQANKVESINGAVTGMETIDEYIYIVSEETFSETIYQIRPKAIINTKLTPRDWWATVISSALPANWLPTGKFQVTVSYLDETNKDPYDETIPKEFRFAKANGDVMPSDDKFSTAEQFSYEIGWGRNEVHYWVKDKWGNAFKQKAIYRGVPSQYFLAGLLFILPAIFVLSCFALAPKVSFCHSAIMNPWLRKYFSLGSVPLLLSIFPSLRHHLLRRYTASINKDKEFTEWKKRFVCPDVEFQPDNFGQKLESERRLLLIGLSGIGKTSFFKRLTTNYASQNRPTHPAKVFPVYIPLINYGGNSLEDLVYIQLFSYGKITDKDLAPMFLEQGGLLIFLDGVNEVQSVADRQKLSAFVERYWTSNYICLSSQHPYPEIEHITKVQLKPFSREKVCEFLRERVNDKEAAENVIKKITDEGYQLYSVPRDLEFAVEILNSGEKSLPRSRTDLYRVIFSSIFTKWKENGAVNAEDNLCRHAYTMIVQRDLVFDSVDDPHFKEVTIDLFEQKFLVRREGSYNFRHDLIRSYLASGYFYQRWKNLFGEITGKTIDSNWLEMLKFSCENIEDSDEVKSLVYEVLKRSVRKDLVKDLFEWLKANYPSKCKSWENDFYAKYGELDFK